MEFINIRMLILKSTKVFDFSKKMRFNYKSVIVCCVVALLFLFSNLDKNICEIFLANRKINVDTKNVLLVKGINSFESKFAGAREKIAETVLMLNEFGADKIVFDFDLSKKSDDNLFFDADSYLENCLKVKGNIASSSDVVRGTGLMFDYKNVGQVDAAVIETVKDNFEESSSIDYESFYDIKVKENKLVKYVSEMEDNGYFEYTPDYNSPYAASVDFVRKKELLFEKLDANETEKISAFENYVEAKNHFVDSVLMYLEGSAKELLSENADERDNDYGNIEQRFSELKKCFDDCYEARNLVKGKIEGSTCILAPDDIVYNLAAVIFCLKSFVKVLPWWIGLLIAIVFCIGCDVLCSFVKTLEQKVCVCLGFIYLSILIPYIVFYFSGVYIGTIVCFAACAVMLACQILIFKYGKLFEEFNQFRNGDSAGVNEVSTVSENTAVLTCRILHYTEIVNEFETEKDSEILFNRYYELIKKTAESFGGKEKSNSDGIICYTFTEDEENDDAVMSCKAALKIKSVIAKLNAKLMKEEILGKEIEINVNVEMII